MSHVNDLHSLRMQHAIKLAQKAFDAGEVPIGAVVVDEHGAIIGRGFNRVEQRNSQTAHAEIIAIAQAGKKRDDWRLGNCWLYVTLEPCAMCMNLSLLSRLSGVVYGAASPLFGYHLDNELSFQLYKKRVLEIIPGVKADDAARLLRQFFLKKRMGTRE